MHYPNDIRGPEHVADHYTRLYAPIEVREDNNHIVGRTDQYGLALAAYGLFWHELEDLGVRRVFYIEQFVKLLQKMQKIDSLIFMYLSIL